MKEFLLFPTQNKTLNLRSLTYMEQTILCLIAVGCKDNRIAELPHTGEKSIEK